MQNDNLKRFFCFFLCFILLTSCVPLPAHAVGVDWILRQIATDIGVSAILEGLGIFRDSASDYFGELVSQVSDALDTAGQATSGFMNVYYKSDPLGINPLFAVPLSIITFVRNWVFDNDIVVIKSDAPFFQSGFSSSNLSIFYERYLGHLSKKYHFLAYQARLNQWVCGSSDVSPFEYVYDSTSQTYICQKTDGGEFSYTYVNSNTVGNRSSTGVGSISTSYATDTYEVVDTDKQLTLGVIPPSGTLFNEAYPQWLEHQRELEDGTTETVVQIGLGNTQAETESLTQEQIWSGQGTLTVPDVVPGTATLSDVISAIVALPGQIVTSITTALTNFFTISGEASSFGIQLKDFFPFCIPFDLFDFLTVLSADPQAPVFKWEIPVPQLGRTFEFEVDLSPWDPVASVFRTFELLAFIVGLALITREKFLRS